MLHKGSFQNYLFVKKYVETKGKHVFNFSPRQLFKAPYGSLKTGGVYDRRGSSTVVHLSYPTSNVSDREPDWIRNQSDCRSGSKKESDP